MPSGNLYNSRRQIYICIAQLGAFHRPTSQLQQGWMNTSAFSVIDVDKQEFLGAIVVDEPERGAAGIWSIACNDESVFISHSERTRSA